MKVLAALLLSASLITAAASAEEPVSVFDATLAEAGQSTEEVSTRELREIIRTGAAVILDARPPLEFAVSHIPGALNVSPAPGRPAHQYISDVAEVGRLVGGDIQRPLVLYCNGPFCGKTKRLGTELVEAGYTNVRRYQLGAPVWRALGGGAMETELHALPYIAGDETAVWIDAREPADFLTGTVPGSRNVPASGLRAGKDRGIMREAKDDGRLPMNDHNTRIIVFGKTGEDARAVADAIASEAFHNVSFVREPAGQVIRALAAGERATYAPGEPIDPVVTPIVRTNHTTSGQPIRLPQGDPELVAVAVDIPAGGSLPIHQHPWSRFVYIERGNLRVTNHDTKRTLDFRAGQIISEVVGQWHEATALGAEPARLIVFDLVPPGVNNVVPRR